jgi:hypothetical protein
MLHTQAISVNKAALPQDEVVSSTPLGMLFKRLETKLHAARPFRSLVAE